MDGTRSRPACRVVRLEWASFVIACSVVLGGATAFGQIAPRVNYLHNEFTPPGVIAQEQLRRNTKMAGYFQAVELIPPEGAQVSIFCDGDFVPAPEGRVVVGMQLGYVYSLKLTQLPLREGIEIFPTVEIINRTYPPEGTKIRFPVPVEISEQDISQALSGLYVTRVVYLEDSDHAFPRPEDPLQQRTIEVSPTEDPLHVADRHGRPMAIVRIGSRVPDPDELLVHSSDAPRIQFYPSTREKISDKPSDVNRAIERHGRDVPRQPDSPAVRGASLLPGRRFLR